MSQGITSGTCHKRCGSSNSQPSVAVSHNVLDLPLLPRPDGAIRVHDGFGALAGALSAPAVVLWGWYPGTSVPEEVHLKQKKDASQEASSHADSNMQS